MKLLIAHEPQVDYPLHDVRGQLDRATFLLNEHDMRNRLQAGQHLMMDCSAAVTCLCKWAGLHDPNGLRYAYEGYTGTLLHNLPHYQKPVGADVGALVVFGPGTGEHVAMVLERDPTNPLLFSHGFQGGPLAIRLHDEQKFHKLPVTFLSIASLG
jgi:hypothetical protein